MDPEYFRSDDVISLTPGEWQELVASIQNLVQANNALLQTVSELMAQRNEAFSHQAPPPLIDPSQTDFPKSDFPKPDPYDLRTLNRLFSDKP